MSVKRICEAIIRDERSILQISTMMDGEYGIKDVVLSMPSIVGAEGFISKVPFHYLKMKSRHYTNQLKH